LVLTCIGNDYEFNDVFVRQVKAGAHFIVPDFSQLKELVQLLFDK